MKWVFVWRKRVWRLRVEHEHPAAVLEVKAHALDEHARAEVRIWALDERCDISIFVNHTEIDCFPSSAQRIARRNHTPRMILIDQCRTTGSVFLRKQFLNGYFGKPRIAYEPDEVLIGQFLRLDLEEPSLSTDTRETRHRKSLHDVQHLECRNSQAVRR